MDPHLFKSAFIAAFKINRYFIKWKTNKQRTSHMISHIYRTVSDYLYLDTEYEYNKIDVVFFERKYEDANDSNIVIAVEHENYGASAHNELKKLADKDYPMNVVITYLYDGMKDGVLVHPNFRDDYLRQHFIPILNTKKSSGKFMIIVNDKVVDNEQCWLYYLYDNGSFKVI